MCEKTRRHNGMKPLTNVKPSLRSFLFCDVTQHWLFVSYWCCRTTYQYHRQGWSSLTGCPKMLVITTNQCCVTSQNSENLIYSVAKAWNHETMVIYRCSIWNPLVTLKRPHQCLISLIFDEVHVSACLLYCLCDAMLQLMEGWFSALVLHTLRPSWIQRLKSKVIRSGEWWRAMELSKSNPFARKLCW